MTTILAIGDLQRPCWDGESWFKFGESSAKGLYFYEMWSSTANYILEIPIDSEPPKEFYQGFFKQSILMRGRGVLNRISLRQWSTKYHCYLDKSGSMGYWNFMRWGVHELIEENIRKSNGNTTS